MEIYSTAPACVGRLREIIKGNTVEIRIEHYFSEPARSISTLFPLYFYLNLLKIQPDEKLHFTIQLPANS